MKFIIAPIHTIVALLSVSYQKVCLASSEIKSSIGRTRNIENDIMGHGDLRSLAFASQDQTMWERVGQDLVGIEIGSQFGDGTVISADGGTVAIGARFKDGDDGFSANVGTVRLFRINNNGKWIQMGGSIDGQGHGDRFGRTLALNGNGDIVAIGAPRHDGRGHVQVFNYDVDFNLWFQLGKDIDGRNTFEKSLGSSVSLDGLGKRMALGDDPDESGNHSVRVFDWDGVSKDWKQIGDIKTKNSSVSLSGDGKRLAVAFFSGSDPTVGKVKVFTKDSENWVQLGQKISGRDGLGRSISTSYDGNTLAIGGNEFAQVYMFIGITNTWYQVGTDILPGVEQSNFGMSISLDGEGEKVAIGAPGTQKGCNPNTAGFVRVLKLHRNIWSSLGEFSGNQTGDRFGFSVGFSRNGGSIVIGAPNLQCMKKQGYAQVHKLKQTPSPTRSPSKKPTEFPTRSPSKKPTAFPTGSPSKKPTLSPTSTPTKSPSKSPTKTPSASPTISHSLKPTIHSSTRPTMSPSVHPTSLHSSSPTRSSTTLRSSSKPTLLPQTVSPTNTSIRPQPSVVTTTPTASLEPTSWTPLTAATKQTGFRSPFIISSTVGGGIAAFLAFGLLAAFFVKRKKSITYARMARRRLADDCDAETETDDSEKRNVFFFATNSVSDSFQYDAFLSCNWGIDGDVRNNHERVSKINKALKEKGIRTYFQEDRKQAENIDEALEKMDNSAVVITFVTSKYIDSIADKGENKAETHCKKEFEYALKNVGNEYIMPVIMERSCADWRRWGLAVGLNPRFCHSFIMDYELDSCVAGLVQEIKIRKEQKSPTEDEGIELSQHSSKERSPLDILVDIESDPNKDDWADTIAEGLPWISSPNNSPVKKTIQ